MGSWLRDWISINTDPSQKVTYPVEKAPKKSWPGSIIIVTDILATISIGRQLRSSMNSDRSSDVSSDYG